MYCPLTKGIAEPKGETGGGGGGEGGGKERERDKDRDRDNATEKHLKQAKSLLHCFDIRDSVAEEDL